MSLSSSDRLSVRFSAANINSSGIARTAFRAISSYCKNGEGYSFSGIPLAFRACFPRAALLGAGHTPPAASLAAVADRYVDVSDPGFHAAKIRRIFLCRKGTGDFVLRILRFSGPFPPERRCGTLLARSDVYAVGPRTIPALFALRTDRLAGRNGLPLPDALPERAARGGDHLCPAARADARAGRTVPVAAQCGGRIADRRGRVLFPRPHCPAGLDGSEQGPGRRARSAGARGLRAPRGRTRPRPYGLRSLAGEQPAIAFGRNPETRAAAPRSPSI